MNNVVSRILTRTVVSCLVATAVVVAEIGSPPAFAAGGTTIENAPVLVPGIPYSGDTSTDPVSQPPSGVGFCAGPPAPYSTSFVEWWGLALVQGDQVLLSGQPTDWVAAVYPPGTTDEDLSSTSAAAHGTLAGLAFTATVSGTFPAVVGVSCPGAYTNHTLTNGPYSLTLQVKHEALLYTTNVIRTGTATATMSVYVRYPGGRSISDPGLTVYLYGRWRDVPPVPPTNHVLARGHPVNGSVNLSFKLPATMAGKRVPMIVTAAGTMYQPVHEVRVTDIVAPKKKA